MKFIVCEIQGLHQHWCEVKDIVKDPQRSFREILKITPVNEYLSFFFFFFSWYLSASLVSTKIHFKFQKGIKLVLT